MRFAKVSRAQVGLYVLTTFNIGNLSLILPMVITFDGRFNKAGAVQKASISVNTKGGNQRIPGRDTDEHNCICSN